MKCLRLTPLAHPVKAVVNTPGSKSYTNRALLLGAMTPGTVKLINPLISDDTRTMMNCLQALGVEIVIQPNSIEVVGDVLSLPDGDYELDAGLSGTTMRFMLALCAVLPGRQTLRGQPRLQERPVGQLVKSLRQVGAEIKYLGHAGYPPLLVSAPKLRSGIALKISGQESSQYLSALLMAAPLVGGLTIKVEGRLNSKPYVNMTCEIMQAFGALVDEDCQTYHVKSQAYKCTEYSIEGDVSSASYFFAIAALTGSTLTVQNLNPQSQQADMGFLRILQTMGLTSSPGNKAITFQGTGVRAVSFDMRDCPDQAQTLAVLAAFADGVTTIAGIQSLRIKETERIKALQQELAKMGIKTEATPDSLTIHGGQPGPASIATYDDHRMAMAFAVAGTKLNGMEIQEPDVVAKTFPDFWKELATIGVKLTEVEKP